MSSVDCYRVSGSGYALTQQALGVAIAVLNKMVDDTDNQKERGNAENKTTFCFTRYT